MKIRKTGRDEKIELQMTPMIDIVFQLLVFFIMTFKIVLPEGDFSIRMPPPAAQVTETPKDVPPLQIVMKAGENRELVALRVNDTPLDNFAELHAFIRGMIDDAGGPGTAPEYEAELVPDYDLEYANIIKAITAVSGYLDAAGQRHQLVEKIRFAPPGNEP
jgi:biopolymer transport protein ExbD